MSHSQMSQSLFCRHRHLLVFLFQLRIGNRLSPMILQPDMVQGERDGVQRLFPLRWLQLALPYRDAMPPHRRQSPLLLLIPFLVPANLRHPEVTVCLRYLAAITVYDFLFVIILLLPLEFLYSLLPFGDMEHSWLHDPATKCGLV